MENKNKNPCDQYYNERTGTIAKFNINAKLKQLQEEKKIKIREGNTFSLEVPYVPTQKQVTCSIKDDGCSINDEFITWMG